MIKKVIKKKKPERSFTAKINVLGKNFSASGASISEAISNLKPGNIKGKVILTLSKGKKIKERILMPFAAMRLFNTAGLSREVNLKHVSMLFQGFDV